MTKLLVAAAAITATAAPAAADDAAAPRPLLSGTYEVTRMIHPDGSVEELPASLLRNDIAWARMALQFDGDHVTISSAALFLDGGHYRSCEAALTADITWSARGFTVAASASTVAVVNDFSVLTSTDYRADAKNCTARLAKGAYRITVGKQIRFEREGESGTNVLVRSAESIGKINWPAHVP
jgi:hypothetical protein